MTAPNDKKLFTVAICTYNRGDYLRKAVEATASLKGRSLFELIVVDNSSNDEDRRVADALNSIDAGVRVIRSQPPGLSIARNVALEACTTEFIAYIDDDALPMTSWAIALGEALTASDDLGFFAGPIDPIWPDDVERPKWINEDIQGAFTILDLGPFDRLLKPNEFAYGANMAFRTDLLRQVGGFNSALGRVGSASLLSEEEIDVQEKILELGYQGYYAASAKVRHHVDGRRLAKNWLISRMAWQGVSVAFKQTAKPRHELYLLMATAMEAGFENFVEDFFREIEKNNLSKVGRFLNCFIEYALRAKDLSIPSSDELSDLRQSILSRRRQDTYDPSASVSLGTKIIFFDGKPGHDFLFDAYGAVQEACLVRCGLDQWSEPQTDSIHYLEKSLTKSVTSVVLLTLDPFIFSEKNFQDLNEFIHRNRGIKIFGILHRIPESQTHLKILNNLSNMMTIFLLSESMKSQVQRVTQSMNFSFLPLHSALENYLEDQSTARRRRHLPTDTIIISLLGELRDGKGVNHLIDSLKHFSEETKKKITFLIVGKATNVDPGKLKNSFNSNGFRSIIIADKNISGYKIVPDIELADYVAASDIGLLLCEGKQQNCMSGMLPSYVQADVRIISSHNSVVGDCVREHSLGWTVDVSDPLKVARTIEDAVEQTAALNSPTPFSDAVKHEFSMDHAVRSLVRSIDSASEKEG